MRLELLFALVCLLLPLRTAVGADVPTLTAVADPALESRVQRVSQELRCLVCQNQTIADSNADLAVDLRREVRVMLSKGASEDEVRRFMVARYGDFVLYRPPLQTTTLALWAGPFVLLLVALYVARRIVLMRRRSLPDLPALTPEEQRRLVELTGPREPEAR